MLKHELEYLLAAPFSKAGFTSLMREVLPGWHPTEAPVHLNASEHDLIVQATSLGTAAGGDAGLDLEVFIVQLASGHSVHSSRSAQRALMTRLLRKQQREAALAAFYAPESDTWRLSFVHLTWQHGLDGKVKTEVLAPLRRYSFIVGRSEPIHTATSQLWQLIQLRHPPTLDDIEQAFSIERVTKEFYQRIAILFSKLTGGQRKVGGKVVTYNPDLHLPSVSDPEVLKEFAVRLIGRLLFAWFLSKKHPDTGAPLMPPELLSMQAVDDAETRQRSYYHDVLERVFFEVLNTPVNARKMEYHGQPWSLIPFLSSNLFEARSDDYYEVNETGQSKYHKSLAIPNKWFHELLELFSEYNFTIDENLSVDVDLAIEPEMLGRVFENLLAEINPETDETARKATGSYYTPRQIVDFMVDEALKSMLLTNTKLSEQQTDALLAYDGDREVDLSAALKLQVLDAFDHMKVLDPACGSGAFPMGILQKALLVLGRVDPGSRLWEQRQLDRIMDAGLREQLRDKLQREEREFVHKIGLVRNCIYGVDIQPIAVEMSKLRFLLSLMVDETVDDSQPNRGIMPLPNLEFKFACANSLIRSPGEHGGLMAGAADPYFADLGTMTAQYFDVHEPVEKMRLRSRIETLVTARVDKLVKAAARRGGGGQEASDAVLWNSYAGIFKGEPVGFFEVPYFFPDVKDGFSIVIGNPPYIREEDIKEQKPALRAQGYTAYAPRADLYVYFYERALWLLAPGGVLCYISSNKFMRAKYGEDLRRLLSDDTTVDLIVDLGGQKVFESATVDTCVVKFRKQQPVRGHAVLGVPVGSDYSMEMPLRAYVMGHAAAIDQQKLGSASWTIADDAVLRLKSKIAAAGKPLKEFGVDISRGIVTGLNEAFVVDTPTRDRLCREDPHSAEIIKPVLRGRDIARWAYQWSGLYIILASYGSYQTLPKKYPAVYRHLKGYEDQLKKRGQCHYSRTGTDNTTSPYPGQHHWLELDNNPQDSYLSQFEESKIMYPEFSTSASFMLDANSTYCLDTGWFISSSDLYLLGILNSALAWWYLRQTAAQLGNVAFRMKKIYLEVLPVVVPDAPTRARIEQTVKRLTAQPFAGSTLQRSQWEAQLNTEIYRLYGLGADEIALIQSSMVEDKQAGKG